MKKLVILLPIILGTSQIINAQFADSLKAQILQDWKRSKLFTLDYLNVMPDSNYSFSPTDSTRTFAQQMIHISQGTISLIVVATDMTIPKEINRQNLETTSTALAKDSVIYFVTLSYDYAIENLAKFDFTNSYEHVKRGKFNETRLGWIMKAFEHQAHHRGQATIYIRLIGLKPPNERLFDNMYD